MEYAKVIYPTVIGNMLILDYLEHDSQSYDLSLDICLLILGLILTLILILILILC